jgi:hypothetical protein
MSLPVSKSYLETQLKSMDKDFLDVKYLQSVDIKLKKLDVPTDEMLSSYELKFTSPNGEEVTLGDTINIPKDYLLKEASIKVCEEENTPVNGYAIGDKYIDFIINTVGTDGNESHLYISFNELFQFNSGDGIVIENNEIKVGYLKGLEIYKTKLQAKIGEGVKFDTDGAIALDFETENIDFSKFGTTEETVTTTAESMTVKQL